MFPVSSSSTPFIPSIKHASDTISCRDIHKCVQAVFTAGPRDTLKNVMAMEIGKAWKELKAFNPMLTESDLYIVLEFEYQDMSVLVQRSGGCLFTMVTDGEVRAKYEDYNGSAKNFFEKCNIALQYSEIIAQNPDLELDFYLGPDLELDLMYAKLKNANLSNLNLRNVNMVDADLSGVNLSHSDLEGTDMSGALLIGANLGDCNLKDLNLTGANLDGANLVGAINLVDANFENASLIGTIWTTPATVNIP